MTVQYKNASLVDFRCVFLWAFCTRSKAARKKNVEPNGFENKALR